MTPEGKKLVQEFMGTMHRLVYPQPIVAKVVEASMDDLNTWRKRRYLSADGWEADGRVTYTGMGLLTAGMMNVLAWHFGPVAAEEIVVNHVNWLTDIEHDKDLSFQNYVIKSTPDLKRLLSASDNQPDRAHYLSDTLPDLAKRDWRQGAIVIFPIGALVAQWSLRAMIAMERA